MSTGGLRQFWLEPVRALRGGEQIVGMYLDVLPPLSQAGLRWPDLGHHRTAPAELTWQDLHGRHYTSDAGWASRDGLEWPEGPEPERG